MEYATPTNAPRAILLQINDALCRILPEGVYFTLLYARLNRRTRRLTTVNAGHPPAVIVPADGGPRVISQEGDVVGAFSDAVFGTAVVDVVPGDRLLAFTDGLIEADGPREAGMARLVAAAPPARALPLSDFVERIVAETLGAAVATDDIVVLGADL